MSHYRPRRLLVVLAAIGLAVLAIAPAALSRPASREAAAIKLPIGLMAQVVAPEVTVTATDAAAAEAGANTGTFTVTRSGDTTGAITVNYSVGGTATSGDDYQALSGSVNLAAGVTTAAVTVTPIDDSVVEGDETVILTLVAGTGYSIGSPSQATVTIADNDPPVVSIIASDANASEAGADTGTFTVSRTGPTTAALTINYTIGGTAAAADYGPMLSGSLVIPAGSASANIVITPVDDAAAEGNETLVLTLAAGSGYALGSPITATVNIADNDLPQVNIRATDANAAEAGSNTGTFQISRTGPTTSALTVLYMVGGTAAQADYNPVLTGSVTIPAGQSTVDIVITPVDDAIDEGNETVILSLTASGLYSIGADDQATVTIADDDDEEGPPPTVDRNQKEECKKGGWQNFANLAFKNQGDCVSYFATGGKNPPNG